MDEPGEDSDTGHRVWSESRLVATPLLKEQIPHAMVTGTGDPGDLLLVAYADENLPEVDGVWWNYNLNPDKLSAPAGSCYRPA